MYSFTTEINGVEFEAFEFQTNDAAVQREVLGFYLDKIAENNGRVGDAANFLTKVGLDEESKLLYVLDALSTLREIETLTQKLDNCLQMGTDSEVLYLFQDLGELIGHHLNKSADAAIVNNYRSPFWNRIVKCSALVEVQSACYDRAADRFEFLGETERAVELRMLNHEDRMVDREGEDIQTRARARMSVSVEMLDSCKKCEEFKLELLPTLDVVRASVAKIG